MVIYIYIHIYPCTMVIYIYIYIYPMENHSFVDDFPMKTSMYHQFSHIFTSWMAEFCPSHGPMLAQSPPGLGRWDSFLVPFALYLQQLGTRICHFAWYLRDFGMVTMVTLHCAWYLLHLAMCAFHFAWYLRRFGTSTVHVAFLRVL